MKRVLKYIAAAVALALLMLAGGIMYLLSPAGTPSLLNLLTSFSGVVLQWETLEGALLDGIEMRGVSGSAAGTTWTVQQLRLRWQPARLRERLLLIDELAVSEVVIRSQPTGSAGQPLTPEGLQSRLFSLPITLDLRQLHIDNLEFARGETSVAFESLDAAVVLDNERLAVSALQFGMSPLTLSGQAQLAQSLALSGELSWQWQREAEVYSGTLGLGGNLQQIAVTHVLASPLQVNSNGTLQPALFANDVPGFDLQHEFPQQTLALVNRPDTSFAASVHTTGNTGGGSFDTDLELMGTVQGYPVALNGHVTRRASGTLDIDIDASSESNMISVIGSLGQTLQLDWQVQAPALQELLPTLSGSLMGAGQLGGTRELPEISGTLNGQQLGYEQAGTAFLIDTLAFTAGYGPEGNAVQFQLGTLARRDSAGTVTLLQGANVTLEGTPAMHSATATIDAEQGELQLALQSSYVDQVWSGTLASTTLRSQQYGDWTLNAPLEFSYGPQGIDVSRHCWNHQQLVLCGIAALDAERRIDAEVTLEALPLDWLNANGTASGLPPIVQQLQAERGLYLPEALSIAGTVDLRLQTQELRGLREGSADLVLTPHEVELQWEPEATEELETDDLLSQHLALTVNRSEVHLRQGTWSGAVDGDVAREDEGNWLPQGNVRAEGSLDDADVLDATLAFEFGDLTWLETAVPQLRDTQGRINGLATVSGPRTAPRLQLQTQLSQARFDVPEYGLEVRNVALAMTTLPDESLQITGSAESGPGTLRLDARVEMPLRPERRITADLSGNDILIIDTASARSHLIPDLHLDYSQTAIAVSGGVELLDADFDLETLFRSASQGAVPVSSDVVIVRGAPETTSAQNGNVTTIPLTLDMAVKIGEGVRVYGYDLDATLAGEVSLRQTPGQSLLVYGELGIPMARYSIYNQQLNAEDGRLMFFGNPANPVLDLRAFRTTESAEVGVWLNGALSEVRGELYSTPALPDNEILSLLVTGKSFGDTNSEESDALLSAVTSFGLGRSEGLTNRVGSTLGLDSLTLAGDSAEDSALGLGKYLTPNLLMRYKVGLFDRQSVLGIEYTLNEHLKLKVESGISQSLEISYTIEKD